MLTAMKQCIDIMKDEQVGIYVHLILVLMCYLSLSLILSVCLTFFLLSHTCSQQIVVVLVHFVQLHLLQDMKKS